MPDAPFGLPPATTVQPNDLLVGGIETGVQAGTTVRLTVQDIVAQDHSSTPVLPDGASAPSTLAELFSVNTSAVTAGTTQATAFALVARMTMFVSVSDGAGAVLPPAPIGTLRVVVNLSPVPLLIWPDLDSTIDSLAQNAPVELFSGAMATFARRGPTSWVAV